MSTEEQTIWKEKASMRDFYVNPIHWFFTFVTLGLYLVVVYLVRLNTRYTLTNERLIKESGLLGKRVDEIELFRVKDTKVLYSNLCQTQSVRESRSDRMQRKHARRRAFAP